MEQFPCTSSMKSNKTKHTPILKALLWALPVLLLAYACAHVVAPTGGPRDEDPPVVVRSTPPNRSANFTDDQIRIFFDEFITLRNIRQQLLISPPMEQLPEIRVRGRSIIIDIEETLRPNSTYNFFFGDAIRDITEGNAIPSFQFVFSTGDYVDSLAVSGKVRNAFNLKPERGIYVMLYDNIHDSVPLLERPVYLAKTDAEGRFTISNIADGEYRMFALDDKNNNFRYDLPDERIGFVDSLVRPVYIPGFWDREEGDTLPAPVAPVEYTIALFQEKDTVQRVLSSALSRRGLITVAFRVPFDSAYVREIREPFESEWHISEFGRQRDTLKLWFAETGRDSLFLEIRDGDRVLDTIRRATTPRRTRDRDDEEEQLLNIAPDFRRPRAVPFFQPLAFKSDHPIEAIDTTKISVYIHDSVPLPYTFRFSDHVRRRIEMDPPLQEETNYRITLLPGAFTDIFGLTHDTLTTRFSTTSQENYGNIFMEMAMPVNGLQYVLQLLDLNENVLQEKVIHSEGTYVFRHLSAGRYRLRLIEDLNHNGRWDTGHYIRGIQPEPVHMLPDTIQVRENWDIERPWVIR